MNNTNRQNHLTTIGILLVFLIIAICGAIATIVLNNDETVYSEPEHVHNYGELVEKVDATLDADGHWAYYHCEECGKYFDSNKKEIDEGDLIIYGGHNYVYHERVEPTCTQNGKHEYYTCTDCDKKFNVNKQEVASESQLNIASLKHDYDSDNIEFTWTPADNSYGWSVSAKYVCKRCGDVVETDASITTKSATWNQDSCIIAYIYIYENKTYYYSEPKSRESDAGTATMNQWTPWEYDDHLPTEIQPSGSQGWYLTKDVTLAETWTVPANGIKLCLNGHVVTMTGSGSAIYVPLGSMGLEFTLCEYNFDETHYYYIGKTVTDSHNNELNFVGQIADDESDPAYVAAARKGSFEGGYITGGTGRVIGGNTYGGAVYIEGDSSKSYIYSSKFTLQGATLFGNHADYGGAVYVATNAYFKTHGDGGRAGYIIGNQAGSEGGGVYANKRNYNSDIPEMNEGMETQTGSIIIAHNTAGQSGNGYGGAIAGWVCFEFSSTKVYGNAAIGTNAKGGAIYGFLRQEEASIYENYTTGVGPGVYVTNQNLCISANAKMNMYSNFYAESITVNEILPTARHGDIYFATGYKMALKDTKYPPHKTDGVKAYIEMQAGTGNFMSTWTNDYYKACDLFAANIGYKIDESGANLTLATVSGNVNIDISAHQYTHIYPTYYGLGEGDKTNTNYYSFSSSEANRYVFSGTKTIATKEVQIIGYNYGVNNVYLCFSNLNLTASNQSYIFLLSPQYGPLNVYIELVGDSSITTSGTMVFALNNSSNNYPINVYFTGSGTVTFNYTADNTYGHNSKNGFATYSTHVGEVHVYNKDNEDITIYERVSELIQDIGGEITYTKTIRERIDTARAAYDALDPELQLKVVNRDYLLNADENYKKASVKDVIALISKIPVPVVFTSECKETIDAARAAYDAVDNQELRELFAPNDPQEAVTNRQKLFNAEETYATIQPNEWNELITNGIALPDDLTYNGNPKEVALTYNDAILTVNVEYFKKNANNEYEGVSSCINSGDYKAIISSTVNDEPVSIEVTFTINKALAPDPIDTPTAINVGENWTLADVELPDGWRWVDDLTTPIGDSGVHEFEAVYNPDAANYLDSDPATVTLTVKHIHNSITFTAWKSTDSLPTEAGNYCLTANVVLSSTWEVPLGTTNLCLIGHGIIMANANQSVVTVNDGAVLNIYDCGDTIHYFDVNSNNCAQNINETEGSGRESFIGGYITGGQGTDLGSDKVLGGGFFVNGGNLHMYGGTVIGNSMTREFVKGAGVWVGYNGTFTMENGASIIYNFSDNVGGGVCVGAIFAADSVGTFVMNGGEISNNRAAAGGGIMLRAGQITLNGGVIAYNSVRDSGGAIDFEYFSYSTLQIGGNPVINNNFKYTSGIDDNIVLRGGDTIPTIEISSKLTSSANIYLIRGNGFNPTTAKAGVFIDGWSSVMGDAKPSDYFHSDNQDNVIYLYQDKVYFGPQPHLHDDILFTAWTETDVLPTSAGNYYLTQDMTISSSWNVPEGTTNLCLNGFGIKTTGTCSVIVVASTSTLNIYDCGNTTHYFEVNSNSIATNINNTSGSKSFTGGYIAGGKGNDGQLHGGGIYVNGTCNLYGGNIIGNQVTASGNCGAGVYCNDNSTFRMYGGSIIYNYAQNSGCAIFGWHNAEIDVYGGEIAYNKTNWSAGSAISFWNTGSGYAVSLKLYGGYIHDNNSKAGAGAVSLNEATLTVGLKGNLIVKNNTTADTSAKAGSNLYVGSKAINIEGALTNSEKIYIRLASGTGTFTSGWSTYMDGKNPADYFVDEAGNDICLYHGEAYCGNPPHEHNSIVFNPWSATDSLPTSAGNYYLTNDVKIDSTWEVPSGTTNLCLNGHGITMTGSGSVISVGSGITFNLYDCDSSTTYYYIVESPKENGAGLATICDEDTYNATPENARGTFTGGYITGGNADKGAGINANGATVSINGGTIIGNSADAHGGAGIALNNGTLAITGGVIKCNETLGNGAQGGGVCLTGNSTVNMTDGVIELNVSEGCGGGIQINNNNSGSVIAGGIIRNNYTKQGGGINAGPSFTFTGGVITGNIATGNSGGGVFAGYDLIMSGSATIQGNKKSSTEPSDIVLWHTYLVLESSIPASNVNPIVIGRYNGASQGVLTSGWTTYMDGLDPNDYFASDNVDYAIFIKDDEVNYDIAIASVTNGERIVKYETIDSAVNAWVDGTKLTLLRDVEITEKIYKNDIPELTLDLNGKTITLNSTAEEQRVIQINGNNCVLNLIDSSGTNAGRLTGVNPGAADNGLSGALYINSGAIVNMYGGTISGNASMNGAGVWIDGRGHVGQSKFNMYGGLITGNTATNGGGVYVGCQLDQYATTAYFNMYGGTITGNTATNGNNVYIDHGIMTMIGGTINGGVEHSDISDDYVVVTFDANGGMGTMSEQYVLINANTIIKENEYYNLEAVKSIGYTREGYTLVGWNTQADGLGNNYVPGESSINISENITLYAKWDADATTKWSIRIKAKSSLSIDPAGIIEDNETIVRVHDVTLYKIIVIDGVEQEPIAAQPSDIGPGATITVKLTIPDLLIGKNFRILHVHAIDDYEFVTYSTDTAGLRVTIANIDRLSDFAFVALKSDVIPEDPDEGDKGGKGGEGGGENNPIEPAPEKEDDPNIDNWTLTPKDEGGEGEGGDPQKPAVEVALEDCDPQEGVTLEIEVRTDVSQEIVESDNSVLKDRMQSDDEIAIVYDVKLIRITTDPVTGIELREEIQPSDVKPGAVVVINMDIPEALRGKAFKVLHVHAEDDINEIPDSAYTISEDGTVVTVRVTRLSEFALLGKKAGDSEPVGPNKIPDWAIALIVIGGAFAILLIGLLIFFFIKRDKKEKEQGVKEIPIAKEEKLEEPKVEESEDKGIGLKESIKIATTATRSEKITKAFINAYLSENYANCVEINTRENYTKTGLPLADTHYVKDKDGKMVCFIYVYETDGATMLILKTKDALGKELEKECKNAHKSAFPKSKDKWYSIVIDDNVSNVQVLDMLDRTIAVYTGAMIQNRNYNPIEQEGLGLKESLAIAATATRSEKITKAFINAYLTQKYPDVVEINTRENYTKTGLPLADTHYVTTKDGNKICFIYAYETDGATMLLLKTKDALGEELAKDYKTVNKSAFPKAKERWYSVVIDDSLTDEAVKYMIDRTIALYTGATIQKQTFAPIQTVKKVTVAEAINMIEDDVAKSAIIVESTGEKAIGKKSIVNIDILSNNFKNGDVVNIDALKAKKLIPNKVGYVKLLARGSLDKKLHVELQDYSIEAVKMVIATGGTVKKV
ncbi:MAG: hypothetical protein E7338_02985 [Clostridiales bacterium]|nr:hypothetical protein [Clostridiales bacterium]